MNDEIFVAMVLCGWDTIDVRHPLQPLPVNRSELPGVGYMPVYATAAEARKEHGDDVSLYCIQRVSAARQDGEGDA